MNVVLPDVWVVANFKETALTHMKPGDRVSIEVDAYPDEMFHGHVDSIQMGTGALQSAAAGECDGELCEGRAARAGEDRIR